MNYCQFKALPSLGERIPTPEEGNDELRSALEEVPWEIEYEESAFAVTNMILSYQDQQWLFRFKQGGGPFGIGQGPRGYEEYSPIDQDALLVTKTMDIYNSLLSELQKKNFEDGLTIIVKYANQDKDDYLILHQGIEAQNLEEKPILVQQVVEFFGYGVEPRYKDVLESPIPEVGAPINVDRIISRIQKYDKDIELYSTQKGLDSLFVRAIISRESQGISSIGSSAGAIGLMQVMPGTAKGECNAKGDIRTWLKDPKRNIVCGTTVYANYYKQVEKFVKTKGGDTSDQENLMKLTLAAYNGGPARVECLINQYGEKWEDIAKKASGRFGKECKNSAIRGYVRLPSETKNYVGFVLGYYYYYKQNDIF